MTPLALVVTVIVVALIFGFINGFHDTGNAIATVVSTGVLRPRSAIFMAAVLNVVGAFIGTSVATTVGRDTLDPTIVTQAVVLAALLAAIFWNLFTWFFGIPSSSSHALLGGLVGAGFSTGGLAAIQPKGIEKALAGLLLSPVLGFLAALVTMITFYWLTRRTSPSRINVVFRRLQLVSAGLMALSHGTNDAQKTMGVVTMALLSYTGASQAAGAADGNFPVPDWVIVACALTMGLGTAAGGWRIIQTMGQKLFKLRPIHGCAAETAAAAVLQVCSAAGIPASTTHCITSAIMGAGATTRLSAVSWGVTRRILWTWASTIPVCILLGMAFAAFFRVLGL